MLSQLEDKVFDGISEDEDNKYSPFNQVVEAIYNTEVQDLD